MRAREEANVVNPGALVSGIKSSEPLGAAWRIRDFIEGFRAVCGAGVQLQGCSESLSRSAAGERLQDEHITLPRPRNHIAAVLFHSRWLFLCGVS